MKVQSAIRRLHSVGAFQNEISMLKKRWGNGRILNKNILAGRHWKLAALAACLFFASSNAEAQRPHYFGQTTDPTPVAITIQDKSEVLHFRIPKMYMAFSENWKGGLQEFIVLELLFPSMAPLSSGTNNSITSDSEALVINLQSFYNTRGNYNIPNLIRYYTRDQWTFIKKITDKRNHQYKYYVNQRDVEKKNDDTRSIKEFFVPDEPDIYLECLKEAANPNVGCSGFVNYGQNLLLRFQFKKSQFERWPEMRGAAVTFLNSLRQHTSSQQ